ALLGDGGADSDVLDAMAVVVQHRFPLEHAVLPFADTGTRLALRSVEHLAVRGEDGGKAVLLDQAEDAALAHARGADHGVEVALEVARVPDVEGDRLQYVVSQRPRVIELQRGDAD